MKYKMKTSEEPLNKTTEKCDVKMVDKLNCWDYKKRCKEMNSRSNSNNLCPAKNEVIANGLNGGINGGRMCWVIMDAHCKKKNQTDCFQCEFQYKVIAEEGLLNNCNAIGTYLGKLKTNNS
jgi:hypothetical protein